MKVCPSIFFFPPEGLVANNVFVVIRTVKGQRPRFSIGIITASLILMKIIFTLWRI